MLITLSNLVFLCLPLSTGIFQNLTLLVSEIEFWIKCTDKIVLLNKFYILKLSQNSSQSCTMTSVGCKLLTHGYFLK